MRTSNRNNRNNSNSKRGTRSTRRNRRRRQTPPKRKTSRKMNRNRNNKSKNCGCMRRKKSLGKMNKNRNRQSGGFQESTGPACRQRSTVDRDTSLFQSMFRDTPTPSNEPSLDGMVYALNNSESRGRYAPFN